jgi:hypothetical protein
MQFERPQTDPPGPVTTLCYCREKPNCPLSGACLTKSVVYMAEVTAPGREPKQYIGMTEHEFKRR